jgi:hypothetical protein
MPLASSQFELEVVIPRCVLDAQTLDSDKIPSATDSARHDAGAGKVGQPMRNRQGIRLTLRECLRVAGTGALVLGMLCAPVGLGVNPKRDQSAFHNLADMMAFSKFAAVAIVSGLVLLVASALLPRGR